MTLTFIHLGYSPWSEKARWALEHHQIAHHRRTYLPMLGEPLLRLSLRRPFGRVSVPVLVGDGVTLTDSYEIARYADAHGSGTTLRTADATVEAWNARSEVLMASGRARTTPRVLADTDALLESVPKPLAQSRVVGRMIGTSGARFLLRKYQANRASLDEHLARMEGVLAELQVTLDGDYILGELSYADIVMAAALQFVKPVDPRYIKLGPASARAWTDLELCDRYRDLLDWRDALYARDRKR